MRLSDLDKEIMAHLQGNLPLQKEPYAAIATEVGLTTAELLEKINCYLESGAMRRLGTILHHHQAGYVANAMCGWVVPPARVEDVGTAMASFSNASHVYLRPTYPDWPYNLFTMLHGKSVEALEAAAEEISEYTGIADYKLLYSVREFKKTSMQYF
ncbi:MAG: Lrp/AsnC family transcriptional regulator [Firmicutes bacterium]|nr:Lrp/AsnC family transcriptional regulator [Bacillota bacterium]